MRQLKTLLTVVGGVTILVLAGNTIALATTGKALIDGGTNASSKVTVIQRTVSGSALNLKTASSTNAPLSVNGKGKVTNLNADTVDGYDSSTLLNKTYVFTKDQSTAADDLTVDATVPAGNYLVTYDAFLNTTAGALDHVGCNVFAGDTSHGSTTTASTYFNSTLASAGLSASGIVTRPNVASGFVRLICTAFDPDLADNVLITTQASQPAQLTLTRIDTVSSSTVARVHAR